MAVICRDTACRVRKKAQFQMNQKEKFTMAKDIKYGEDARKALQAGIDKLADTVGMLIQNQIKNL